MNKHFLEGFEKYALQDTLNSQAMRDTMIGAIPFGTSVSAIESERPEGHGRLKEFLARVGLSTVGGEIGARIARNFTNNKQRVAELGGKDFALLMRVPTPKNMAKSLLGIAVGASAGEYLGSRLANRKYYDDNNKLKEEYK